MKKLCREVWIEVDLDAIKKNIRAIRRHITNKSKIMAVVKANAYGHGSVEVARQALESGASELAVASVEEGIVLRRAGITAPILVLGFTALSCVKKSAVWNITLSAFQVSWIKKANQILEEEAVSKRLSIHINVDTGMGRLGVRTEKDLLAVVKALKSSTYLSWDGIFTHFSTADEPDTELTMLQHEKFISFLRFLKDQGITLPTVHMCNTAAAIAFPEFSADMIRLGIGLYGLYPSAYIKELDLVKLTPVLSLKARIAYVKAMVTEPRTVSYGATYIAEPGEIIATIPIGYADGYSRALSNRGFILYRGRRVPVAGRVTMDMIMVSLGESEGKQGEEVVIYGKQKGAEISVDEIAEMLGTINYEVVSTLSRRVPRFYIRDGEIIKVSAPVLYV
ncbi:MULTISPECIES: alanine racemase [Bacillus]|uniref:alanine racemase n=1 Tax=Bacillus TaxID=1386 RepID=UPI000779A61F|nr:alanine racemase [Bacillus amyloliquefaciens]KYC95638.1 Alanine racemase [Bacillus amyloliquefaciens]MBW8279325.1 alanine racemase [Bacillus amyloliquefaciens]MEC1248718.1 alanine racemase [Bacillus amyloliquefaciens]MEC2254916.1 alanine racemase [Bacillus amyloliquefaciens]MED0830715.1 alanine racemase [Bacillus amyloliquefaciens]